MQARDACRWLFKAVAVGAVLSALFAAGCASLPSWMRTGINTPEPASIAPQTVLVPANATSAVGTLPATTTAEPFELQLTPLPTETALPTIALPTEAAQLTGLQIWDGLPTYPADSNQDFRFRVLFDPNSWALVTDAYGFPVLAHRDVSGCVMAPAAGRGLSLSGTVDHDIRRIGQVTFQIGTAYVNDVKTFVNYTGGDGNIYTAFQVSFSDQSERCLSDAETVLGTLRSVPLSEATPIATP